MTSGIYQIRNLINNKVYIGSAANLKQRWYCHQSYLKRRRHNNVHLQRAWNKCGDDAFVFEVLITCHPSMCIWYEQQFLDQWKPAYNISPTASSSLGVKHTDVAKRNMGNAQMGRKHTDETKHKISKAHMGNTATKGRKLRPRSAQHKRRLSEAGRGRVVSIETRRKLGAARAKPFPSFVDPDGTVYPPSQNLRAFCREHGLCHVRMWKVLHGKRNHHKGWRLLVPIKAKLRGE